MAHREGPDAGRSGLLRYWLYSRTRDVGKGNGICAKQVVMAHRRHNALVAQNRRASRADGSLRYR